MISLRVPVRYPPGEWRPYANSISFDVAGVHHRKAAAAAFVRGAEAAERKELEWGVRCERDPSNKFDANAVAVFGWWTRRGLFGQKREDVHIGFWPREMAAMLAEEHPLTPISARPTKLYLSDQGFVDIEIVGLIAKQGLGSTYSFSGPSGAQG